MTELQEEINSATIYAGHRGTHCKYRMFNRHGGVSGGIYASMNVGDHVGDEEQAVRTNRQRVKKELAVSHLLTAKQVHGTGIYCLTEPLTADTEVQDYDAMITDLPDVGLLIQHADCQAVLLFDPERGVIAAVHSGWRGSVQRILEKVITVMVEKYQTAPGVLRAVISPSLGPCCAEFVNHEKELPEEYRSFMIRENYFDFWKISTQQLIWAGLSPEKIKVAGVCTCCSDDYFSYRRSNRHHLGLTGRNCSIIALAREAS